ncbi:MAG: hypothetical protein AAB370_10735 [Verrucomicrobiota bacterium]
MNPDFARAIVLKVAFKPEPLRRAQAALLYVAMTGQSFTADCLPGEIVAGDTKLPGLAVGTLARIGLIQSLGFTRSPSLTRHGSWVQRWRLADGKDSTAKTWLKRNGFDATVPAERQLDLLAAPTPFPRN